MSYTARKLMSASGGADGPLNVEDVFSTYLYEGNSSTQTITNGIDLAGEGGLVWTKGRTSGVTSANSLFDTERGVHKWLRSNSTGAELTYTNTLTAFNSNGFTLFNNNQLNYTGEDYVSWTFRKAPKFFDIVTYTGNGTAGRTVSHNLGSVPGFIIFKQIDDSRSWGIYHRGLNGGSSPEDFLLVFDSDAQSDFDGAFNDTAPTSTEFTLGNWTGINDSGGNYIAYLFAHNDGDGEFGPNADQDIIKCGSFSLDSNGFTTVDIGFEPQWVLVKSYEYQYQWRLLDVQRGANALSGASTSTGSYKAEALSPSESSAESLDSTYVIAPNATGFSYNAPGLAGAQYDGHVYIAIRRGTKVPESGTEVFAIDEGDGVGAVSAYTSGFPVDFAIDRTAGSTSPNYVGTRLLQRTRLQTDDNDEEAFESAYYFDYMEGWRKFSRAAGNYSWMWKRAPKYFDVVGYAGTGSARTVNHNLGVVPEMIWVKKRTSATNSDWGVYHIGLNGGTDPEDYYLRLNDTNAELNNATYWNDTAPTASNFTVNTQTRVNNSGDNYIAYLFATLAGISKVGSVTHSGSSTDVNCGFSSGARFVMLKRTDASGDWYIWDSTRGIVSGNDPYLLLNSTAAQVTNTDYIDPLSSGFTITDDFTDGDYIFYAIA